MTLNHDAFDYLKVLGEGSFQQILLARRKWDGVLTTVKVLHKRTYLKSDRQCAHRAENEYRAMCRVSQHPFIISMSCSFQTERDLYFFFDFIVGDYLALYLASGPLPESRARFYTAELVSALTFLHRKGIVHCDVKPGNILVDRDGHVVLTGFGYCQHGITGERTTNVFHGTTEYMAPEVMLRLEYNHSVDWWSLGIVLYEMLYGFLPFDDNHGNIFYRVVNEPVVFPYGPPEVSAAALDFTAALLNKNGKVRLARAGVARRYPFLRDIRWNDLEKRRLNPPWRPQVRNPIETADLASVSADAAIPTPIRLAGIIQPTTSFVDFHYESHQISQAIRKYNKMCAQVTAENGELPSKRKKHKLTCFSCKMNLCCIS